MSADPVRAHRDWGTASFLLPPVAERLGPFVTGSFLSTWAEHRAGDGDVELVDDGNGLLSLFRREGRLTFAGEADLTDYHSPLGVGTAELLASYVTTMPAGTEIVLDSLPSPACETVEKGLQQARLRTTTAQHEIAAILDLPGDWDTFLVALSKKQRHEVRRKNRRFTEQHGSARLVRLDGVAAVEDFSSMHREAYGDKGGFMTRAMEHFFLDLHRDVGAVVDVLTTADGSSVAASFGFEDESTYYLYNSAYRTAYRDSSPGIVLISLLIRRLIRSGRTRLDFLKGDEDYKFRLGAVARPLFRVTAKVGS